MNLFRKIFGCKCKDNLYIYVTTFTVIDENQRIAEYFKFDKRLEDKVKKRLRRRLQKSHPKSTIKVKGRFERYRR